MESESWKHYKKDEKSEYAVCNYCTNKISIKGSSTTGLIRHLKTKHGISIKTKNTLHQENETEENVPAKKPKFQSSIFSLAKELLSALKSRFNARRNKQIVSVIQFLQNPQILKSNISFEELNLCSKTEILKTIKDIMNKHFQKDVISEEEQNCSEITTVATEISQPQNTTLLDKLQQNVASRVER